MSSLPQSVHRRRVLHCNHPPRSVQGRVLRQRYLPDCLGTNMYRSQTTQTPSLRRCLIEWFRFRQCKAPYTSQPRARRLPPRRLRMVLHDRTHGQHLCGPQLHCGPAGASAPQQLPQPLKGRPTMRLPPQPAIEASHLQANPAQWSVDQVSQPPSKHSTVPVGLVVSGSRAPEHPRTSRAALNQGQGHGQLQEVGGTLQRRWPQVDCQALWHFLRQRELAVPAILGIHAASPHGVHTVVRPGPALLQHAPFVVQKAAPACQQPGRHERLANRKQAPPG
mmetsp:Transcript_101913/g.202342  ORF Transcript_101913/g.202342 Transcript_101913/m.202342 type:complete len:278 (+) Transcript_101913:350-1183(+)